MTVELNRYLLAAVSPNTINTYRTGLRKYMIFCGQMRFQPWPLQESVIEYFCVGLASSVGYKTIKVYLCGVQFYSRMAGFPQIVAHMPRLPYVLRGIRRRQGPRFIRPQRMPITISHLHLLHSYIERTASVTNGLMLKAAILIAFFGLLRVSEYTCPTPVTFFSALHLSPEAVSVKFYRGLAYLLIKNSKTDHTVLGSRCDLAGPMVLCAR